MADGCGKGRASDAHPGPGRHSGEQVPQPPAPGLHASARQRGPSRAGAGRSRPTRPRGWGRDDVGDAVGVGSGLGSEVGPMEWATARGRVQASLAATKQSGPERKSAQRRYEYPQQQRRIRRPTSWRVAPSAVGPALRLTGRRAPRSRLSRCAPDIPGDGQFPGRTGCRRPYWDLA